MRIAIIGSGISGLTSAWLLHQKHDVTVFEAGAYVGGHTNTVDVKVDGRSWSIDTGFIVCNDRTYPNFLKLMDHLNVGLNPTEMGFSVSCDVSGLEYSGSSLKTLYAQKRNLFRPAFHRMVLDILKFNRVGTADADCVSDSMTVAEYLQQHSLGDWFRDYYLLPMGAAIWSCPVGVFADFPIRFILQFYRHHGLLSVNNRPQWYTVDGGSATYVRKLIEGFLGRIRLNEPVRSVSRFSDSVCVRTDGAESTFDEVIVACHSDQALRLLTDPSDTEREVLSEIRYEPNEAVLHTDESLLPSRRSTWSSWNYRIRDQGGQKATLTYDMNILQGLNSKTRFCVTLNDTESIRSETILGRYQYAHPVFTTAQAKAQQRHSELIRTNRTSFCGAYWKNGFHEDGVVSGLAVGRAFGAADILDQQLSMAGSDLDLGARLAGTAAS